MRVGLGFDIHRTSKDCKLILGGVEIESEFGLVGHSDADVLIHAVIDAILGALGLGDIGDWFSDKDEQYKDISSVVLLKEIIKVLDEKNKKIVNLDCNIMLEEPKLYDQKSLIKKNLARILGIDEAQVNVKAKTNEKLGCIGRGEAIEAQAIVLVKERNK